MEKKLCQALVILAVVAVSLKPLLADGEANYSAYISALQNLQSDKFTDVVIQELTAYLFLFPNAANLDEMHYKITSIYAEKNEELPSFYTHLQFVYLYPNSKHTQTVKDRLRTLLIQKKKFKQLKDKVETILNPIISDSTREAAHYAFLRDLYEYDFAPITRLLIKGCEQFIEAYPNSANKDDVIFWHAELLARDKQHERALSEYMKLTYLFNHSLYLSASKLKMAEIFAEHLKMHQNAILTLEEFLLEYPDDPQAAEAQFQMAKIIEKKKKKYLEAINAYTAVAEKYPESIEAVPALFEAARLYEDKFKEYDQAIRLYTEVVRDFAKDLKAPYALAEAARIYEKRLDDYINAANVYFKVYGHYPKSKIAVQSLYAAAQISERKLQNPERAIMYYRLVVDEYPDDKLASKASKRLEKLAKEINP